MSPIMADYATRPHVLDGANSGTGEVGSLSAEILLIEQDDDQAQLIREEFSNHGFGHHLAATGTAEEGLHYLYRDSPFERASRPDIILLNLRLTSVAEVAVMETVKRMRAEMMKRIAVVALVSRTDERTERAAAAVGADRCFVKPRSSAEEAVLSTTIREFWQGFRSESGNSLAGVAA